MFVYPTNLEYRKWFQVFACFGINCHGVKIIKLSTYFFSKFLVLEFAIIKKSLGWQTKSDVPVLNLSWNI